MTGNALYQGNDPMLEIHFGSVAAKHEAGITHKLRVYLGQTGLQTMSKTLKVIVFGCQRQPRNIEVKRQQLTPPCQ
ncbi:hypothetical protein D3C79_833180 [compost metagenome]